MTLSNDVIKIPNIFMKTPKITVFLLRREGGNKNLNVDVVFKKLDESNIQYKYFDKVEDFYREKDTIKDYTNLLFFLTDAPKNFIEITLIDDVKPEYVSCFTYPNMSIVTSRYSKFKPLINSDISLPFSPFSSALERTFLYNLAKEIDTEGSILEIGAYSGGTSIALGTGNKDSKFKNKIFSIDCAFQQDYPVFIQHAGLSDYIITRQCPSQYFASVASDVFTLNAGSDKMRLVWIDGDHSYEGCLSDLKLYKPFLRDNGILVIHDYGAEDSLHGGITQAVFEEVISDPEYSNFAVVDTIFYAEKNRSKPFIDFDAIEKFTVKSANDPYSCVVFMNDNYSFKNKKTCIYGAGQHTESILNYTRTSQQFSDIYDSITLLIDDQEAANGSIHNKPIINFDALNENDFDYIIVSSYDYENIMLDKLLTKVKNKSRIISFYNNNDFIDKRVSNINTITSQELLDRVFPVKNLTE